MKRILTVLIQTVCVVTCANSYPLLRMHLQLWLVFAILIVLQNVLPFLLFSGFPGKSLRVCNHGTLCLKAFTRSTMVTLALQLWLAFHWLPGDWKIWLNSVILSTLCLALIFWNGMLCVYLSSYQLGIKHRVTGMLLGMIPIANLIMLEKIIRITDEEVRFETEKLRIDQKRETEQICKTQYPILLVHGVFFRDNRYLNY